MAQIARCDECGKEEALDRLIVSTPPGGWFTLTERGRRSSDREFCGLGCVSEWAAREGKARVAQLAAARQLPAEGTR